MRLLDCRLQMSKTGEETRHKVLFLGKADQARKKHVEHTIVAVGGVDGNACCVGSLIRQRGINCTAQWRCVIKSKADNGCSLGLGVLSSSNSLARCAGL